MAHPFGFNADMVSALGLTPARMRHFSNFYINRDTTRLRFQIGVWRKSILVE
jgi:hypothetical protein